MVPQRGGLSSSSAARPLPALKEGAVVSSVHWNLSSSLQSNFPFLNRVTTIALHWFKTLTMSIQIGGGDIYNISIENASQVYQCSGASEEDLNLFGHLRFWIGGKI